MQSIAEPPSRRQIHLAIAAAVTVVTLTAAVLPFGKLPGPFYPQLALGFGIAEVMAYLSTSILLLSEAAILRNAGYARLGAAYLFAASMFIPGVALVPDPYEARGASYGTWLLLFLDGGFALLSLLYVLRANDDAHVSPQIRWHIIGALLLALLGCGLTWFLVAELPLIPQVGGYGPLIELVAGPLVLLLSVGAMLAVGIRLRARTPADLWLMFMLLANVIDIGLTLVGNERFSIGWYFARIISLGGASALLLPMSMEIIALVRRLAESNQLLDRMAYTDTLTGLANRRQFDRTLSEEYRRAQRNGTSLALIMLDIDQFKRLNDTYGHSAGDECLRRVATVLRDTARRSGDTAARVGGEEFAILLASTNIEQAVSVAEQICAGVRELNILNIASDRGTVTVSVGVAVLVAGCGLDDRWLVGAADRTLYEAKGGGRDRIVAVSAPPRVAQPAVAAI
jgi:diguanylate cyclase (GGDEF)-like protein